MCVAGSAPSLSTPPPTRSLPEEAGSFEKVFPRSAAKTRAWSDTSDFISTRDSFSSLDEDGVNNQQHHSQCSKGHSHSNNENRHQQLLLLQLQQVPAAAPGEGQAQGGAG